MEVVLCCHTITLSHFIAIKNCHSHTPTHIFDPKLISFNIYSTAQLRHVRTLLLIITDKLLVLKEIVKFQNKFKVETAYSKS